MKNLILIVLLVIAGIAGYNFVNTSTDDNVVEIATEVATTASNEEAVSKLESSEKTEETATGENLNMNSPADMPKEEQTKMYNAMADYNKCMLKNRLEYQQQGNLRAEAMAEKTLFACDPLLDDLKAILAANNINEALREGMVRKMRSRAARKLIGSLMQAMAGQAMAAENIAPGTVALPQ